MHHGVGNAVAHLVRVAFGNGFGGKQIIGLGHGRSPTLPGQPVLLGDIVLALETCEREARELEKPLADHVRHLLVHGMLHLLGFDHETDADAEDMEREEIAALAAIGVANPYPDRV
ncbi:MAG: rRNA maturation RNase YbeY [Alphaproteobacteria bacterium]|nr:rRNA maturation RNase YbeY [Alphaproteobacteria bacterium]